MLFIKNFLLVPVFLVGFLFIEIMFCITEALREHDYSHYTTRRKKVDLSQDDWYDLLYGDTFKWSKETLFLLFCSIVFGFLFLYYLLFKWGYFM